MRLPATVLIVVPTVDFVPSRGYHADEDGELYASTIEPDVRNAIYSGFIGALALRVGHICTVSLGEQRVKFFLVTRSQQLLVAGELTRPAVEWLCNTENNSIPGLALQERLLDGSLRDGGMDRGSDYELRPLDLSDSPPESVQLMANGFREAQAKRGVVNGFTW